MKKRPPKELWTLFDKDGDLAGTYASKEEARNDAWGPRFHEYAIRRYDLVPRHDRYEKALHKLAKMPDPNVAIIAKEALK